MKNIKKLLATALIISSFISLSSYIQAEPNVELYNKSKNNISMFLNRNGNLIAGANIPAGGKWNYILENVAQPFSVEIRENDQKQEWVINAPSKTYYLSYTPTKSPSLYPQTGTLMGLLGKSDSGFSLKNNLKSSDIIQQQQARPVPGNHKIQKLQQLLGLPFSTSAEATKKAYFAYAFKNHPDKMPIQTDEQKNKYNEISMAYSDVKDILQQAMDKERGL
jgi:hypothetical protein